MYINRYIIRLGHNDCQQNYQTYLRYKDFSDGGSIPGINPAIRVYWCETY